jgi:hypothetical protein
MTIGDDGIANRDNTGASFQKRPHWLEYKPCKEYAERKSHDWRWLGWPLGSIIPLNIDEKWCESCGLIKRPYNGRWVEAGYRESCAEVPGEGGHRCASPTDDCRKRIDTTGPPKDSIQCPVCKGSGELIAPHTRHKTIDNTIMAKLLRDAGYSYRDIMKFLGYKSPRSVALCLQRKVSE